MRPLLGLLLIEVRLDGGFRHGPRSELALAARHAREPLGKVAQDEGIGILCLLLFGCQPLCKVEADPIGLTPTGQLQNSGCRVIHRTRPFLASKVTLLRSRDSFWHMY